MFSTFMISPRPIEVTNFTIDLWKLTGSRSLLTQETVVEAVQNFQVAVKTVGTEEIRFPKESDGPGV